MLTGKANQKKLNRQIRSQYQGKRQIHFEDTDHDIGHGCYITWILWAKEAPKHIKEAWICTSWIVELTATGRRDGRPFQASHLYRCIRRNSRVDTSLRTTPKAVLRLVQERWSNEEPMGSESLRIIDFSDISFASSNHVSLRQVPEVANPGKSTQTIWKINIFYTSMLSGQ